MRVNGWDGIKWKELKKDYARLTMLPYWSNATNLNFLLVEILLSLPRVICLKLEILM